MTDRFDLQLKFDGSAVLAVNNGVVSMGEYFSPALEVIKTVHLTRDDVATLDSHLHDAVAIIERSSEIKTVRADEVKRGDYLESFDHQVAGVRTEGNNTILRLGMHIALIEVTLPCHYPVTVQRRVL